MSTTLRIRNNYGEEGGQWFCNPNDKSKLAYVRRILAEMQQQEPEMGWKLETRGDETFWHSFEQ